MLDENAFYIVDLREITKSYKRWITLLPNIKPFYAVKCNPNIEILKTLSDLGVNFDCASEEEMKIIMNITNNSSRIIYANPCKIPSHIRYACNNNINLMTFDSEEELYKIKLYNPYSKLLLRLAVDDSNSLCKFNEKFGCIMEEVKDLLIISKKLDLNIIGFSFHVGSGCSSADSFYKAIKDCRDAVDIAQNLNINITIIDIGGGFPGIDTDITFESITNKVNEGIKTFFKDDDNIKFIAEPGRYFAQKTHTLYINIINKKKKIINNENIIIYYVNDSVYNSFNCILFDHCKPVIIPLHNKSNILYKSKIYGATCDSMDLICKEIMLPELIVGDICYVENFGAYTIAAASEFNGIKKPINRYIQ